MWEYSEFTLLITPTVGTDHSTPCNYCCSHFLFLPISAPTVTPGLQGKLWRKAYSRGTCWDIWNEGPLGSKLRGRPPWKKMSQHRASVAGFPKGKFSNGVSIRYSSHSALSRDGMEFGWWPCAHNDTRKKGWAKEILCKVFTGLGKSKVFKFFLQTMQFGSSLSWSSVIWKWVGTHSLMAGAPCTLAMQQPDG